MTNFCIDKGNTSLKLGVFVNNRLLFVKTLHDFSAREIQSYINENDIHTVVLSDVSGENIFEQIRQDNKHLRWLEIDYSKVKNIDYKTPHTLGKDRISGFLGAVSQFGKGPFLIIDCGTCFTFDFVDENATFMGGNISPGVELRFKSMNENTKHLPKIFPERGKKITIRGTSTNEALISGVLYGVSQEIRGYIDSYQKKYPKIKIVSTQDLSPFLSDEVLKQIAFEPNLVLWGLNYFGNTH